MVRYPQLTLALTLALMFSSARASAQYILDVTTIHVPVSSAPSSYEIGIQSPSRPGPPPPFAVTLLDVTPQPPYALGQNLVFIVRITNTGVTPLVMPWVPWGIDHDTMKELATPTQPLYHAGIALSLNTESGYQYSVGFISLEGTALAPDSVRILKSGEVAEIRAPVELSLPFADAKKLFSATDPITVTLRGGVDIGRYPYLGRTVLSDNSLQAALMSAPQR